jgi:hypothetical protein
VNDFTLSACQLAAILGVVFCLDLGHFFFSSLVPLLGIFPLFIYLLIISKSIKMGLGFGPVWLARSGFFRGTINKVWV